MYIIYVYVQGWTWSTDKWPWTLQNFFKSQFEDSFLAEDSWDWSWSLNISVKGVAKLIDLPNGKHRAYTEFKTQTYWLTFPQPQYH